MAGTGTRRGTAGNDGPSAIERIVTALIAAVITAVVALAVAPHIGRVFGPDADAVTQRTDTVVVVSLTLLLFASSYLGLRQVADWRAHRIDAPRRDGAPDDPFRPR